MRREAILTGYTEDENGTKWATYKPGEMMPDNDNDLYCDSRLIELAAKILAGAYKRDPVWAIATLNRCVEDRDKCLELFASAKLNENETP